MMARTSLTRRSFLAMTAAAPLASAAARGKRVPVGLELYSVRDEMKKDVMGTVRTVAKMGYQGVEFYGPYFDWTPAYAKDVRKLLDELRMPCLSTHNGSNAFEPENVAKAIELNNILGSKFVVMASAGRVNGADGWKKVAEKLNAANEKMRSAGLNAGFHNHQVEWKPVDGIVPLELLAKETSKDVVLQLDVGTAVEVGRDPVAWIESNPGRIRSIHLKEYSKSGKGYHVILGEGDAPWKKIFAAAEKSGGVEHYLIEQEGSDYSPFESVERCLAAFKKIHG